MNRLLLIVLILITPLLFSAPTPQPKPIVLPTIVPGKYSCTWSGSQYTFDFRKDGTMKSSSYPGGTEYHGTWQWESKTRILHIHESSNGASWNSGEFVFDEGLKAKGEYKSTYMNVTLEIEFHAKASAP